VLLIKRPVLTFWCARLISEFPFLRETDMGGTGNEEDWRMPRFLGDSGLYSFDGKE
jgi:hypothetical protein